MNKADIVICGGGMVGLTLGLAAAQGGLKVAVVDALAPEKVLDAKFDGRVHRPWPVTSVRMLTALEVWPQLKDHAQPINEDSGHRRQGRTHRPRPGFLAAF